MTTLTQVKERGILFSGPMVRAILEGRKTQTRRPVKPQPKEGESIWPCLWTGTGWAIGDDPSIHKPAGCKCQRVNFPYGDRGDRLWVRETWGMDNPDAVKGRAEWEGPPNQDEADVHWKEAEDKIGTLHIFPNDYWKPSIHMPRWASRITLEITNVRVERIKDITNEDAAAEGYKSERHPTSKEEIFLNARAGFSNSWKKVYPGSWDRNEWVWVIEFRMVQP